MFPFRPSGTRAFSSGVELVNLSGILEGYHDFADIVSKQKSTQLPPHRPYDLKIELEDGAQPPLGVIYSLSKIELEALRKFINKHINTGLIRPLASKHGAPVLVVKKKSGDLQLYINFWGLNKISKKDRYPLLLISDLLDAPSKAKICTKIDLRSAYHLVRIADSDKWKTTFRTPYGSFKWMVMPEGLTNTLVAFQQFVNDIFSDMLDVPVIVYLDNILVYSENPKDHQAHVRKVLTRLRKHGLFASPAKCSFHTDSVKYLGFMLSPLGLIMSEDKVRSITEWR